MNSPTIAIVPHFRSNNAMIHNALEKRKTPAQVKSIIDRNPHYTGYEIVPDEGYIRPYLDWDCSIQDESTNYEEMKRKVYDEALSNMIEMGFPEDKIYFSSRHGRSESGKLKVSWRATIVGMKTTKQELKRVVQRFHDKHLNVFQQLEGEGVARRELIDKFKRSPKGWLDIGVYSSNRKMGLVGCIKKFPEDKRRLVTFGDYPHHYTLISCVDDDDQIFVPEGEFDTTSQEAVRERRNSDSDGSFVSVEGRHYYRELEEAGFSGIDFTSQYRFRCEQMNEGVDCPCLCGLDHTSNQYTLFGDEQGNIFVRSLSEDCSALKIKDALDDAGFMFDLTQVEENPEPTEDTEDEYTKMKRHFEEERQVAMIEKGLVYIIDDENYLNRKELVETFQDFVMTGKKRPIPFTDKWLRDPNKRKFKEMDFLPQGAPPDVYNLWRGYKVTSLECSAEGGDIMPFKKLLEALTDSKEGEDAYNYMLKWTALLFQKPYEKTRVCVVIRSEEGIGKNTYFWYLGEVLMGNDLYKETNQPEHDLFAEHTNAMERKKLVILDEADVFRFHAKICPLITNMETRVRKMYMNPTKISNYAQLAILTNNSVPVKISPSDRRYVVFDGNTSLKGDREYWNNFYNTWAKDPRNQKAVYEYLMGVDLEGFDFWRDRVLTTAYQEIRTASLPIEIKFLAHFITDAYPNNISINVPMKGTEFYQIFEKYQPTGSESTAVRFGTRLKNFLRTKGVYSEFEGTRNIFHKARQNDGVYWYFDRERAFEWLREEQFTDRTQLQPAISYRSYNDFNASRIRETF